MDPETPCGKRSSSTKRKATPAEKGNDTSIWDDNFPFGDFIDNHFITEKDREDYEEWGLEKCFRVLQATLIQLVSIARCMERKVGDLEKSCNAQVEENTKLKKMLMQKLEELSLEKRESVEREEVLIDKIFKIEAKLHMNEDIVNKLKAENEELKDENAGFNEAIKQFLTSVPKLKP